MDGRHEYHFKQDGEWYLFNYPEPKDEVFLKDEAKKAKEAKAKSELEPIKRTKEELQKEIEDSIKSDMAELGLDVKTKDIKDSVSILLKGVK